MDYILVAVVVFLASYVGTSLAQPREKKTLNNSNIMDKAKDMLHIRTNEDEILSEMNSISEWFNGKAGGIKDEE